MVAQDSDAKKFIGLNNLSPALFNIPENNSTTDGVSPALMQLDSLGNPTGILGSDGLVRSVGTYRGSRSSTPMLGGSLSLSDVTVIAGSPTVTVELGPNGSPAIKVVTGVGVQAEMSFSALLNCTVSGDVNVLMDSGYAKGLGSVSMYLTPDVDYSTNYVLSSYTNFGSAPNLSAHEQGGAMNITMFKSTFSTTGTVAYPFTLKTHKLRITPRAGMSTTVYIYGIGIAAPQKTGRVCFIFDDGYDSFFGLGQPLFDLAGIVTTLAVIPVAMDAGNTFAYSRQIKEYINNKNAIVSHGPNVGTGAGNLLTVYPNDTASQVADMVKVRNWIAAQGLATPGYELCYVWPQGAFQSSFGDFALLDAAYAAGFTTGRNANGLSSGKYSNFDTLSKYQHMCMPIIGHTWSGSTANEVTNIAAIVTEINNAATNGTDVCVMLHRVYPTATPDGSMNSIGIRVADLQSIITAAVTQIAAGKLKDVTMPQLAISKGGFWQQ